MIQRLALLLALPLVLLGYTLSSLAGAWVATLRGYRERLKDALRTLQAAFKVDLPVLPWPLYAGALMGGLRDGWRFLKESLTDPELGNLWRECLFPNRKDP